MSIDQEKFISEVKKRKAYRAETHRIIERTKTAYSPEWSIAMSLSALARIAFLKTYPGNDQFPESRNIDEEDK